MNLVVSHFGFDGKTAFLKHQFLVIAYLLLHYREGNHIALSEFMMFRIHLNIKKKHIKRRERHLR